MEKRETEPKVDPNEIQRKVMLRTLWIAWKAYHVQKKACLLHVLPVS